MRKGITRWRWHVLGFGLAVGAVTVVLGAGRPVSHDLPEPIALAPPPGYEPERIAPQALHALAHRPGAVVIVDVRPAEMYQLGHLPDAINVPAFELPAQIDRVPLGVKLALYCS